ncbi:MAG: SEC-C metal-binding domain-containing protein, partial [Pseudomonadota bacterium]|nr:SEC-C metal-binding domain-containing protein [Pseudomonadota bacterium]
EADDSLHEAPLRHQIAEAITDNYQKKEQQVGAPIMRHFEKAVMLQVLDTHWKEHLAAMDYLRQGIHLRGYAHKNPKHEFKREAFEMFRNMLEQVKRDVITYVSKVVIRAEADVEAVEAQRRQKLTDMQFKHAPVEGLSPTEGASEPPAEEPPKHPFVRQGRKIGRNEPCPCGSGKKYKHCHGRLQN